MDTDVLIKVTKASLKEEVLALVDAVVPPAVEEEAVAQGKAEGYADAVRIEDNLDRGLLGRGDPDASERVEHLVEELRLDGGEADALRLHEAAGAALIVSDDERYLRSLEAMGVPYTTAAGLVAALTVRGRVDKEQGRAMLDKLRPYVSEAAYLEARRAVLEGSP